MRYYKCTVLVAVPDKDHKDWSDGGDEGFYLQDKVNDVGGYDPKSVKYMEEAGVHLTDCDSISSKQFKKLRNTGCWPEGGV